MFSTQKTTKAVREAPTASQRKIWEQEQLTAMRSPEVIRHVAFLAAGAIHNQADHEEIAREIIDYLTTPQIKEREPRYTVELTTEGWQIKDNVEDRIGGDVYGSKRLAKEEAEAANAL